MQDPQEETVEYFSKQIDSSKSLIELHQKNIKVFEQKLYQMLLQRRDEIKRKQFELLEELDKIESQLLLWDFIKE